MAVADVVLGLGDCAYALSDEHAIVIAAAGHEAAYEHAHGHKQMVGGHVEKEQKQLRSSPDPLGVGGDTLTRPAAGPSTRIT